MNNSEVIRLHFTETHPDKNYDLYLKWEYEVYCNTHKRYSILSKLPEIMSYDCFVINHEEWIVDVLKSHNWKRLTVINETE